MNNEDAKDISLYREMQFTETIATFLQCEIRLDKDTILDILKHDFVLVNGVRYEVPFDHLVLLLSQEQYGPTVLNLKQV